GGVTGKVFQLGVDVEIGAGYLASANRRDGWRALTLDVLRDARATIEKDSNNLLLATVAADFARAKREHKIAILLAGEGASLREGDLDALRAFHRLGLRELQLRWAVPNQLVEREELTPFGHAVVRECNRLGVIVDLTHIPQKAFDQAALIATKPL